MTILTDLVSPVTYVAGSELGFTFTITAPEDGTYYVLGALYDSDFNYISGTLFGVLLPVGAAYAFNSQAQMSLWELEEDDEEEIDCKFVLDRTSAIMGLFLMNMAGDEPSLEDDTEVSSTSAILAGEVAVELDLSIIVNAVVVVGMMGIMMKVMK